MDILLYLTFLLTPTSPINPNDVLTAVNQNREVPLERNFRLQIAAQNKADALARCQCFSHDIGTKKPWHFIKEAGYSYQIAGENLAADFTDLRKMNRAWMESPGHRKNILNPNFTETGIGIREGYLDGHRTIFVVQMFGKPVAY
jgi:uncharacterized protein YkwD